MKITKQYLKQIILEELTAISGGGKGSGKPVANLKRITASGPDISFYSSGPLGPESKKEYIKSVYDRTSPDYVKHIYKIAHSFNTGDYKPQKEYNGYFVIPDRSLQFDRQHGNEAANGREFLFSREGGEDKAMQRALNFAYTNDPYMDYNLSDDELEAKNRAIGAAAGRRAATKRYSSSRAAEINAGLNEPEEVSDY